MSDYFAHFDLPISFIIDKADLKRRYLNKSRQLHPDFFTLEDESKQEEMLEKSSLNNEAYETLRDFHKRTFYILGLYDVIAKEGENKIPQSFLMEMMDINESLMELEMDYDDEKKRHIKEEIDNMASTMEDEILPTMKKFNPEDPREDVLGEIKDYYFKNRYLLRLKENLNKFATR